MKITEIPIITISYNSPDLISDLIESVRKFYKNPIYVIDGSDSEIGNNIKNIVNSFNNTFYIGFGFNIHHGPGMAWAINNLPLSGPVLFIDSDMTVIEGGFIEDLYIHLKENMYGVGNIIEVNRDGFTIFDQVVDSNSIKYLHPALMLCNIEIMRMWPLPIKHGAPMTETMVAIHDADQSELIGVVDWVYDVIEKSDNVPSRFLLHEGRGTVNRSGSYNLDEWLKSVIEKRDSNTKSLKYENKSLDLGCGLSPRNIFNAQIVYGVDVQDDLEKNIIKADLVLEPIPFDDNFFDFVTAHDFIEHIPRIIYNPTRKLPFVDLMSEIWRVLKMNGKFYSSTPAYPHAAAFWDPTHVNIITETTFPLYFDNVNTMAKNYGFKGGFQIENQFWNGPHLVSILIKV
jgi:SAM-dependent methyltransferase